MSDSTHSEFSPSQLSRIAACPGSVKLIRAYEPEQDSSVFAKEGTMLHDVFVHHYKFEQPFEKYPEPLTDEQIGLVTDCERYVNKFVPEPGAFSIYFEKRVSLADIELPEIEGTADVILINHKDKVVHAFDHKFGGGVYVNVFNNYQLISYLVGSVLMYVPHPGEYDMYSHVVQPRMDNFDRQGFKWSDLLEFVEQNIRPKVEQAKAPEPTFNPGPSQCQWCPVRFTCPYRLDWMNSSTKEVFDILNLKEAVTADDIARFLYLYHALKKPAAEMEKFAMAEHLRGRPIPGYKAVHGRSLRKWKDPDDAQTYLEMSVPDPTKLFKPPVLISPAQAEKLDRALKKDENFQNLIIKPPGAPILVQESDKRPAIKSQSAVSEAFKDVDWG